MNELIKQIAQDSNWNKWVTANSSEATGCISGAKEGCISIVKQGCLSQPKVKAGCIS